MLWVKYLHLPWPKFGGYTAETYHILDTWIHSKVDMLIMAIKSNKESGKSTDTWQQLIHSCIGSRRVSYPAFIWQGIANIASNLDCAKVFDRDHNKKLKKHIQNVAKLYPATTAHIICSIVSSRDPLKWSFWSIM